LLRHGRDAVADPYFGDEAGFETAWDDVAAAAEALVAMFTR
jgi:protein-tyrosine phosphatase